MDNGEHSIKLMRCPKCGRIGRGLPGRVCSHGVFKQRLGYTRMEQVEYVPADQIEGAVEDAAKWEALARRLYALMGEDAERLLPGDVASSELLRGGQ